MPPRLIRGLLATLTFALLAACGAEDGTTVAPTGAVQQNVTTSGAITGFGSVYVNGVHFQTSGASILVDGSPGRQSDLAVGQIVHVKGRVDDRTGQAFADSIRQHDNLEGPITSVDAVAQTFVVLAHTVKVTAETSFDDSLGAFADLVVGLQVEVSGMPDANGDIVATRIEKRGAGETQLEILGKVSALDPVLKHFNIDLLVVDYSTATLRDFDSAGIANGQTVEVKGSSVTAAGMLIATSVERHDFERGDGSFRREIEGLVTRFVSATDFDVAGRPVTTTSSTRFEGGTAANLALNVKVEAEGAIDANGVLVASKIEFKRSSGAGLAGTVQTVTPDTSGLGGTLVVMGVTIRVDNDTRVEDHSAARVDMFRLTNVQFGDYVEVRGTETGPLQLTASRLERRPSRSDSWVRGTVRDLASPNLTILGVAVATSSSTVYEDTSATDFFATAAGRIAKAKGTFANAQIQAREVEFEDSHD